MKENIIETIFKLLIIIFMMSISFASLVLRIKESNYKGIALSFGSLVLWIVIIVLDFVNEEGE